MHLTPRSLVPGAPAASYLHTFSHLVARTHLTHQWVPTSVPSTPFLKALPPQLHPHAQPAHPSSLTCSHTPLCPHPEETHSGDTHTARVPSRIPLNDGPHPRGPGQLGHQAGSHRVGVGQVSPAAWAWLRVGTPPCPGCRAGPGRSHLG